MNKKNKLLAWTSLVVLWGGMLATPAAQAADPRNGAKLYNTHCVSCHGAKGRGNMAGAPDFSRAGAMFKPDAVLVQAIERGNGVMPAFRGLMSTRDILDVIAHLRTLN